MRSSRPPIFVDTVYLQAIVNSRDQWHPTAALWEERLARERRPLLTTEFVLVEFGDALAAVRVRRDAVRMVEVLRRSGLAEIVPASADLFASALALYRDRADKDWGLTDCASFVVMRQRGLVSALTADDHFRQAGFRALLLETPPV